jgi:predicted transcriptional regulator
MPRKRQQEYEIKPVSVRINPKIDAKVRALAAKQQRTISNLINVALTELVEREYGDGKRPVR